MHAASKYAWVWAVDQYHLEWPNIRTTTVLYLHISGTPRAVLNVCGAQPGHAYKE